MMPEGFASMDVNPCTEVKLVLGAGPAAAIVFACNFVAEWAGEAATRAIGMQSSSENVSRVEEALTEKLMELFPGEDDIIPFDSDKGVVYTPHLHDAALLCSVASFVIGNSIYFFSRTGVDTEDRGALLKALKRGMKEVDESVQQALHLLVTESMPGAMHTPPEEGGFQH